MAFTPFSQLIKVHSQRIPQFSDSDLSASEGSQLSVGVELDTHTLESITIKVYATTLHGYINSGVQCLLNITDLLIPIGADSAEGNHATKNANYCIL